MLAQACIFFSRYISVSYLFTVGLNLVIDNRKFCLYQVPHFIL